MSSTYQELVIIRNTPENKANMVPKDHEENENIN